MNARDLSGRTCLITGATAGIGRAAALGLARRGATVLLVARDRGRGEATAAAITRSTGNEHVHLHLADLSSQAEIRRLAGDVERRAERLDVLINCAAVFTRRRALSADGIEQMFATNHLAPFLLSNLLLDRLRAAAPAGVLTVTAPATTRLDFDDLQGARRFRALHAFGATKMANLLFTFALARRLAGSGVVANAYHPGIVRTNLMREAPPPLRWLTGALNPFARTPEQAAAGLVRLAAGNAGGISGRLFHDEKPIGVSDYARDQQVQERLWTESARLTGLSV
jgi:NAD(P)-dependent dehydrogenase (short-subunit alcohol dehydrogenase family)